MFPIEQYTPWLAVLTYLFLVLVVPIPLLTSSCPKESRLFPLVLLVVLLESPPPTASVSGARDSLGLTYVS